MSELKLNPETRSAGPSIGHPRVGEPYTPRLLDELKLINQIPQIPDGFSPGSSWKHMYRIWSSQGWIDFAYKNVGALSIEKTATDSDSGFVLSIWQRLVHLGGILHTISARAVSAGDAIASLKEWTVYSTITRTLGEIDPSLTLEYSFRVENGVVHRTVNGIESSFRTDAPLTSDWTMFEAIQRLPFHPIDLPHFNSMDGLTVIKRGHRVYFRENSEERIESQRLTLRNFYQIGNGVLPYEYWLDDAHRLIMMISSNRVYFLDDSAEQVLEENSKSLREGRNYSGYPI